MPAEFTAKFFVSAPVELKLREEDMLTKGEFRVNGNSQPLRKASFRLPKSSALSDSLFGVRADLEYNIYHGSLFENSPICAAFSRPNFPGIFIILCLIPAPAEFRLSVPCDFRELGYRYLFRQSHYSAEFDICADGIYRLAFAQLHDSARDFRRWPSCGGHYCATSMNSISVLPVENTAWISNSATAPEIAIAGRFAHRLPDLSLIYGKWNGSLHG